MMYQTETKMIGVCMPAWRCYIFSLSVNLLVLAILLPLSALAKPNQVMAQANTTNESNSKQAANNTTVPTALEPAILSEINRVRTNPQDYAQWLEEQRQYYDGIWLRLPGEKAIRTNKGRKALEEAIAFLKQQQPLPPLKISPQAAANATSELENFATANNIQYFSYGRKTAKGIVMGLVVDELFPDRRRRHNLLSPDTENTGVVCKPDPRYAKICAIAYSDLATTTDVAEIKPENVVTPDSNNVVDSVTDLPETIPSPETIESPETTEPEVTRTPPVLENIENPENNDIATLPQPPQPQVPPAPPEAREEQSPQEAEVDDHSKLESEESKSEADEIVEDKSEPIAEAEAEIAEIIEDESEIEPESAVEATESETEEIVADKSAPVTDNEAEAEIAEIIEDESEQVAINSENTGLLEKVERGTLEKGDRVIADDGSLYDFYPLEGKAGESFTIYLESDEFDAFVALVDSQGNTIEENDDISESDSNSRIRVTLPEDGTYNVIVNTYDEEGTGKYVLTVSR